MGMKLWQAIRRATRQSAPASWPRNVRDPRVKSCAFSIRHSGACLVVILDVTSVQGLVPSARVYLYTDFENELSVH